MCSFVEKLRWPLFTSGQCERKIQIWTSKTDKGIYFAGVYLTRWFNWRGFLAKAWHRFTGVLQHRYITGRYCNVQTTTWI